MSLQTTRVTQASALRTESPLRDLAAIIRSRTPLIAVESNEEPQVVSLLRQIARQLQVRAYRWTVTEGMQAFDPPDQPSQAVLKSQEILSYIKNSGANCLFVLLDFRPYLDDNVHVRFLKDIALNYPRNYATVVLVGTVLQIPEELRPFTAYFRLPLPTPDELRGIVYDVAGEWGAEHGRREVQTTNKALDLLVGNLAGLTATDARRLASKAIDDDGAITESDIPEVMRGADLLPSTARQLLLYRALGWTPPQFYHCPLMTDEAGVRLAKRHDALSLRRLREAGKTPASLRAGW